MQNTIGSTKREMWIDIAKAICIISMVIGHIGVPFVTYIYMFHMAAFFMLSGYTYNGEKYTWLEYVQKKIKTLIIPMFLINILFIGFYAFLVKVNLYDYVETGTYLGFFKALRGLFSKNLQATELGGATWFLIVLFWAEIILKTIQRCINNGKFDLVLLMLVGIVGFYLSTNGYYLPFCFDLGLYACFYFAGGVFFRRYHVIDKHVNPFFMLPVSVAVMYCFNKYYFSGRLPMNWPTRAFDDLFIQALTVFCGWYICYYLAKLILKSEKITSLFAYIGRHTFTILVMHFLVFRGIVLLAVFLHLVPISALKTFPIATELSKYWFIIALIAIAICAALSWLAEKNSVTNYIFNAALPKKKGERRFWSSFKEKYQNIPWIRYAIYFAIILVTYIFTICVVYPGKFTPLVPHHSDILDYPYDYEGACDGIGTLFLQTRPIGLLLTWVSGWMGGYKGVMIVGALCTFLSMLLAIFCVEKQLQRKVWIPGIILYTFCAISAPSFYLNYTFDLYNVYALFFGMLTLLIWYAMYEKNKKWEYPLVFILALCGFLCKETYIVSFCGIFFLKIFLEKGNMRKKAGIYFGINCFTAVASLLQARLVNSVFAAMKITDTTSPYYSSVEIGSMLKTAKFYLQGFDNTWVCILLFIGIAALVLEKKREAVHIAPFVIGGVAAYVPYLVLPNRTIPHSFFIAYILSFTLLLIIHPNDFKALKRLGESRGSFVMIVILLLLSWNSINFYVTDNHANSYLFADAYRTAEPYMKITLDTSNEVNEQLQPGDQVLVEGLEPYVETAFRANSADGMFRNDVVFYVVTDYEVYTGQIAPNVIYVSREEANKYSYNVAMTYTTETVIVTR